MGTSPAGHPGAPARTAPRSRLVPRRANLPGVVALGATVIWSGVLGAQPGPAPGAAPASASGSTSGAPAASASAAPAGSSAAPSGSEAPLPVAPAPPEPAPAVTAAPAEPPVAVAPAPPAEEAPPPSPVEPVAEAEPAPAPPPEAHLGLEAWGGLGVRVDGPTDGFGDHEPVGTAWGVGGSWAPDREYTITLGVEDRRLGQESTPARFWPLRVDRAMTTLWAGLRAFPWRTEDQETGLFVALGLGLSIERGSASGLEPRFGATTPPRAYRCSLGDGPRLALGAGLGVERWLTSDLAFIGAAEVGAHQLSGDVLDACAPSLGSTAVVGARAALAWRFDLAE